MARFCTNCGASLSDTAKFCNGCGAKQDEASPVQQQQPQQPQPAVPGQQQTQSQQQQVQQQQAYQQQPQYGSYSSPATETKKKRRIPRVAKIIGIIVLVLVVGITAVVLIVNGAGKMDYYKLGKDQIPSVKLALGEERKVTGTSSSTSTSGGQTKEYTYQVAGSNQNTDMVNYLTYLREKDGFLLLTAFDFNGPEGTCVVGRNSVEAGYEIQLQIEYDRSGYTISLLKQKGGITPNTTENGSDTTGQGNNSQTSNSLSNTGSLTKDILEILNSDTYHMKMNMITGGQENVVEIFAKNGMTASLLTTEGIEMRIVYKNGKSYAVADVEKIAYVTDADTDVDIGYASDTDDMTYLGEGSGDFRGKTYQYDEYKDKDGYRVFFYVDGGELKGIRSMIDGEEADMEIISLDKNISDTVFDIPSNYEVVEY